MKITNKYGLPDAIVRAVTNDPYTKGDSDYSISDLISPPRQLILKKEHYEEIEEDASERVWSLFGQAVHNIAERANIADIAERRLYWKVLGKTISGQMDNYNPKTGILTDYKTATVSKFAFKDFADWEQQQNCYAQLLRWHKDPIKKLEIVALVRDHRPREAETAAQANKPYPGKAETIELALWTEKMAIEFIEERVKLHIAALTELPDCTAHERWARADTYAIKKTGLKNAVNGHANYASLETAEKALDQLAKGHYIEHRPGRNLRCESYCSAKPWCTQFQKLSSK